ncbi:MULTISPECIES: M20/M25/M40 family metallo-hydrolase [unclassified Polaribacter]|uniref:M20/M25/M40 family metallo-hydrolase n=1 Tax=unclassified Polaribacter TaxID=196858 RepID=UPI0011BF5DDF|nr:MULTISPECIES: M20/M25/M40 family metallo-hydrolase [unclassified Polaribacter]TXD52084.1 M20/M25/M40 family metallo-hydrolase [Polaribacter sp. IC063]TXD59806.1 M20/M25/M40 family metallo-hydrolase [Polaribacter sp. IC066]
MKLNLFSVVTFLILLGSCNTHEPIEIDSQKLLETIKMLSDDALEGRAFSKPGNQRTQNIIIKKFTELGLETVVDNSFYQEFSHTFKGKIRQEIFPVKNPKEDFSNVPDTIAKGANIIGMLKGETGKSIVITAHYDHLGIRDGKIYNGADDNASGTAALFAIAEYFKNKPTKHNLIFAAVDAEEIGSLGAEYFLKNYQDASNINLNINLDMIAHSDYDPELFACGLFYYPNLRKPLERVKSDKIKLLFGHDDPDSKEQSDWTSSSDHRVFHRAKIPFIYFGVEDHKDYHRDTDTYGSINPEFYIEAVKVIIQSVENLDAHLSK